MTFFSAVKRQCWLSSAEKSLQLPKEEKRVQPQAWAEESRSKEEDLFEALRALRKQLADQEALPAYIVLSDKVLHLLCLSRPTTVEAFGNINGIGEYKKKKYGKDFVALIRQFV